MFRKSWILAMAAAAMMAGAALAGTFGTVVAIGGEAADVALDEPRGVLYIANFTANRIDVMSLATNKIQTSINVPAQPGSISVSPDDHWLVVANFGNNASPASPTNGLTLIDLTNNNAQQNVALGNPPLGVAFGLDNKALVVTTQEYILFDPTTGTTQVLTTIANVTAATLPVPPATFPTSITNASIATSADYLHVYGLGSSTGTFTFRYDVGTHTVSPGGIVLASGTLGPRVVSVNQDGSSVMAGWVMVDRNGTFINEFLQTSNQFSVGTTAYDNKRGLLYAHMPITAGESPSLQILTSDNLTYQDRLQLPENTTGKSVMKSDYSVMYSVSDSGVLVLPVGSLNAMHRLATSSPDVVFRGNFCNGSLASQTLLITDPGGNKTPFTITPSGAGVTVSPSSGVTPATVTVTVDPSAFSGQQGTSMVTLALTSSTGVNLPAPVRVLVNSAQPDQRGSFVDVPGVLVDVVPDPVRNQYYVLRQDQNAVLVYDSTNNTQIGSMRTYNMPSSLAITLDNQYLLVGHQGSQTVAVFNLDTLQAQPYISSEAGNGDVVRSIAVSTNQILASAVDYKGIGHLISLNMVLRNATQPASLGVYNNVLNPDTVVTASANASKVLVASADGNVFLYDANANTFTASRQDVKSLSGAYAASPYDQYVVGDSVLDASLTPVGQFESATGLSSGFTFVGTGGIRTTAPNASSPGVIQRYANLSTTAGVLPTRMVEAPLLGTSLGSNQGTTCVTTTTGTGSTQICTTGNTVTTLVCSGAPAGQTGTTTCTTTSGTLPGSASNASAFTRTLAVLPSQTFIVSLTTSGFTVLPWTYDASIVPPVISSVVSAADGKSPVAPGGLITIYGSNLSPVNLATTQMPVPTALGNSCLTVNGQLMPIIFVSSSQVNAQLPFQAIGDVTLIVHTPGGVSDNFNLTVPPNAPAVFLSGTAGPQTNLPTVIRGDNSLLVTDSNPVHRGDTLVIYLTGLGQTSPPVGTGQPAPGNPLATALAVPVVTLGGANLSVLYAGLAPGEVGVNQINVTVPSSAPVGLSMPLVITQGGSSQTVSLRVID